MKNILRQLHVAYLQIFCKSKPSLDIKDRVLIIAPHPDDEVIGCGGLIARMISMGKIPHIVILTGGESSHLNCCTTDKSVIADTRRGLTRKALRILGVPENHLHELNFSDGSINKNCNEVSKLQLLIDDLKPESIFVPHWGEGWPDHLATRELGLLLAPKCTDIWEYCVWMWYYNVWRNLDWRHAAKIELSPKELELKIIAMEQYIKPTALCGKPWSGVLPSIFITANSSKYELYFSVK